MDRALRARGGPIGGWTREADVRVYYGIPGLWRWQMAWAPPLRFRLSILTAGDDQHYVVDGEQVRSFVGDTLVTRGAAAGSGFETCARWMSLLSLDVLADASRVAWRALPRELLPDDARHAIAARFLDAPEETLLFFDGDWRLVRAEGAIAIPGVGRGAVRARFGDFRDVAGYVVPFSSRYDWNGEPFFDERVTGFVPGARPPALEGPPFPSSRRR